MKLLWTPLGWEHYLFCQENDARMVSRINELIRDARRHPFIGIGKPEPLKKNLRGWWSRRIDLDHRLVYRVVGSGEDQAIEIAACRFHYGD